MARHGGRGKPTEFGERDLGGCAADRVGGWRPARAEDDRDIVRAARGGEAGGARRRRGEGIVGHDGHHGACSRTAPTLSGRLSPRPVRPKMELPVIRYTLTW